MVLAAAARRPGQNEPRTVGGFSASPQTADRRPQTDDR
jgi:hypothetical protein